jgi:hypothetical protein
VIAPAMTITMPFSSPRLPGVGEFKGTVTMTFGAATASLSGTSAGSSDQGGASSASGSGSSGSSTQGDVPSMGSPSAASPASGSGLAPSSGSPGGGPPLVAIAPAAGSTPSAGSGGGGAPAISAGSGRLVGLFDVRSVYLVVLVAGLVAAGLGWLIRVLGVRRPWTSTGG